MIAERMSLELNSQLGERELTEPTTAHHDACLLPQCKVQGVIGIVAGHRQTLDATSLVHQHLINMLDAIDINLLVGHSAGYSCLNNKRVASQRATEGFKLAACVHSPKRLSIF